MLFLLLLAFVNLTLEVGPDGRLGVVAKTDGREIELVKSIRYRASFDGPQPSLAFEAGKISKVRKLDEKRWVYGLRPEGPAAKWADAQVEAKSIPRGVLTRWTVRYTGGRRDFFPWTTGFSLEFASPVERAGANPTLRWRRPDGRFDWEVAGDAPYPEFECQVRRVKLEGLPEMAIVTFWYDPDWLYGGDVKRARFMRAALPSSPPQEAVFAFAILRSEGLSDEDLSALATESPLSLRVGTGRLGNLFQPGEVGALRVEVRNVTPSAREARLSWEVRDYYGRVVSKGLRRISLSPWEKGSALIKIEYEGRGILFATFRLSSEGWRREHWTTLAFLPE
ncbi:hypothetical protein DRP77_03075, partial [Candidatus Poribacteria bacterium]